MEVVRTVRTAVLAALAGALALSASILHAAPTDAQKAALRSACQADYRAHCASVPPGGAEALQCLEKNLASLSAGCQSAVNAATAPAPAPATATDAQGKGDDAAAAPSAANGSQQPATAPDTGQATQSKAATQPPAAAEPPHLPPLTLRQEIRLIRVSCGPDFRAFCGNVPFGGGNVAACLRANYARLAPPCRAAFSALAR